MVKATTFVILIVLVLLTVVVLGQARQYETDLPAKGSEKFSPADRIDVDHISVTAEGLLVRDLNDIRLVSLADTNSMDPVMDAEATVVEIIPKSEYELMPGDIVSYQDGYNTIIHRIIRIGYDGEWFAVTQGDNNEFPDSGYVRFSQVRGVVVGILY